MSLPHEEICFIRSDNFCISFVKMAEPMDIAGNSYIANSEKTRKYYSIFLNTIASIAKGFDAKIIKNVGDGLVCYFPKTSDRKNDSAFQDIIGFGVTAMAARHNINRIMHEKKLPYAINYRISVDYGRVEVAETVASGGEEDLFGSPMNLCAKINSIAPINGMAIGYNLYQILKGLFSDSLSFSYSKYYDFQQIGKYTWKEDNQQHISYPVYSIIVNKDRNKEDLFANQRLELKQNDTHNIMIVDDEQDILVTYNSMLYGEGYNVKTFSNPHEALLHFAHADKSYYDLIILDIRMPSLNGLQLYHRLKAINKDVKILFLSALEASEEISSVFPELKYGDIIRKPISKEHFVEKINALLQ
ncbi:MAG TPA: response regulator [Nitrososphaeraceae archaeon]|nr:response regulator [Nitrososphaeraceae archaeon]